MSSGSKDYELSVPGVVEKIRDDLAWRGPNGKRLAHVVLERQHAVIILGVLDAERERHHENT